MLNYLELRSKRRKVKPASNIDSQHQVDKVNSNQPTLCVSSGSIIDDQNTSNNYKVESLKSTLHVDSNTIIDGKRVCESRNFIISIAGLYI